MSKLLYNKTPQKKEVTKTNGYNFMTQDKVNPEFVDTNWQSKGGGENISHRDVVGGEERVTAIAKNRTGPETNPVIAGWDKLSHSKAIQNPIMQYTPAAVVPYGVGIAQDLYTGARSMVRGDYGQGAKQVATGGAKAAIGAAVEKLPFHKLGHKAIQKVAPYTKEVIPFLKRVGNRAFNTGVTASEKALHHAIDGAVIGHKKGGILYKK